ncbi:hypothetical protein [Nostoc sp. CHAB 5715]|uniref:hypothetical protein n=1 Tax=Nostoc sp. CHAB 5715 TaxID=2780400 RepID=UPI001E39F788|nr:hypothetical protein [Nostoc sp. CHAB 5715]MCC5624459.1 hypothetical protein [Nostoc sp. CHAB 5715]
MRELRELIKDSNLKIDEAWVFIAVVACLYAFLIVGGKPLILCRSYYIAFPQDVPLSVKAKKQNPYVAKVSQFASQQWDKFVDLITDDPDEGDRTRLRLECQPKN